MRTTWSTSSPASILLPSSNNISSQRTINQTQVCSALSRKSRLRLTMLNKEFVGISVLGCDILTLRLEETELLAGESREEDLPSLLSAKMRVTEDVTNTRQTVLVGTTLGFCLLDLRSRSVLEISVFSQLLSTPSPPYQPPHQSTPHSPALPLVSPCLGQFPQWWLSSSPPWTASAG